MPEALGVLPRGTTVLLDCATLWIARLLTDGLPPARILERVGDLIQAARRRSLRLIVVSNEVGSGVVPPTRLGRAYQDLLGAANVRLAAAAGRVEWLVAGLPVRVKPRP